VNSYSCSDGRCSFEEHIARADSSKVADMHEAIKSGKGELCDRSLQRRISKFEKGVDIKGGLGAEDPRYPGTEIPPRSMDIASVLSGAN